MTLEANSWKISNGLEICIYTFFQVAHKLLLTKKCLKLTCVWVRKIPSCYVSLINTVAKYRKTKTSSKSIFSICPASNFTTYIFMFLFPYLYHPKSKCFEKHMLFKKWLSGLFKDLIIINENLSVYAILQQLFL